MTTIQCDITPSMVPYRFQLGHTNWTKAVHNVEITFAKYQHKPMVRFKALCVTERSEVKPEDRHLKMYVGISAKVSKLG